MRRFIIAAAAIAGLSGCVQSSPNAYNPYEIGQAAQTQMGIVTATRPVEISTPGGTGIGATVGAVAGGIAGAQIGPSSYSHYGHRHRYLSAGSALGSLGGALLGGILGAAIEQNITRQAATEYVVKLDDGRLITLVQGAESIRPGQRVFVQIPYNGRARITPAA